jgi:hypothetical protein
MAIVNSSTESNNEMNMDDLQTVLCSLEAKNVMRIDLSPGAI